MSPTQSPGRSASGAVSGNLNATSSIGAPLSYSLAQDPAGGTVTLGQDGAYTYTPNAALASTGGTDSFRVTVAEDTTAYRLTGIGGAIQGILSALATAFGMRQPDTVTVTVPVSVVGNAAPVAGTLVVGTPDPVTGTVLGQVNATDPDGNLLSYSTPATTTKGAVAVNASTGAFTYSPTLTARHTAAVVGAVAADKTDTFTVTVSDGIGGTVLVPVTVTIGATAPAQAGDIRQQPGGTWRAMYAPNVAVGNNWIGINPKNGGIWLSDAQVNSWLDVPVTGSETAGTGPYAEGAVKVPPPTATGARQLFGVKTGAALSNIYSWMFCTTSNGCFGVKESELADLVLGGVPFAQWVDVKL